VLLFYVPLGSGVVSWPEGTRSGWAACQNAQRRRAQVRGNPVWFPVIV